MHWAAFMAIYWVCALVAQALSSQDDLGPLVVSGIAWTAALAAQGLWVIEMSAQAPQTDPAARSKLTQLRKVYVALMGGVLVLAVALNLLFKDAVPEPVEAIVGLAAVGSIFAIFWKIARLRTAHLEVSNWSSQVFGSFLLIFYAPLTAPILYRRSQPTVV